MKQNVVAIFDVGKTNKKLFLFDEDYKIVYEEQQKFEEIKDEDGFPCEDLQALTKWIKDKFQQVITNENFTVKAVNFSAYGASFIYLDDNSKPLTPLYNYLKPYPEELKNQFYDTYGNESLIARETASPILDSLNSGMQLYRLKYEQPEVFSRVKYALHLPQYLSFLISSQSVSDITSIGCHTQLWDFQRNAYHDWVCRENIVEKLAEIYPSDKVFNTIYNDEKVITGTGLHDSSAALIPYLKIFKEPFILISTGTWCISLNPFNASELTDDELNNDSLCYLTYEGKQVKASRLFAGDGHEKQIKILSHHFNKGIDYYKTIKFDPSLLKKKELAHNFQSKVQSFVLAEYSTSNKHSLYEFESYEEAYHQLMFNIVEQQVTSTKLVLNNAQVKNIFVDGGFGSNDIYMHLLASSFPGIDVFTASIAQASAYGAAIAIHHSWNKKLLPDNLFDLKHFKI